MANALYQKARTKFLNARAVLNVTNATNANPIVITTDRAHGLSNGATVHIEGVGGNTNANGRFTTANVASTTFELSGITGNGAYTSGGEVLLTGAQLQKNSQIIRWGVGNTGDLTYGDNIKVALVDSGVYPASGTVNQAIANHEFMSDVTAGGATIARTTTALQSKTATTGSGDTLIGGVADAADAVFTAVSGAVSEYLVIYKDTGTDSTSPLIAYIDTATGLAVTPNGADINVIWDGGSNRILKI